jgi:hypothetical protein
MHQMLRVVLGAVIILHGLVHIWYVVMSQGWVTVTPEMGWTGRSWLLSGVLGGAAARSLGSVFYAVATVAFVAGGAALLARADWSHAVLTAAALISSFVILAFWDGGLSMAVEKGAIGLALNLVLLALLWGQSSLPVA